MCRRQYICRSFRDGKGDRAEGNAWEGIPRGPSADNGFLDILVAQDLFCGWWREYWWLNSRFRKRNIAVSAKFLKIWLVAYLMSDSAKPSWVMTGNTPKSSKNAKSRLLKFEFSECFNNFLLIPDNFDFCLMGFHRFSIIMPVMTINVYDKGCSMYLSVFCPLTHAGGELRKAVTKQRATQTRTRILTNSDLLAAVGKTPPPE